MTDSVSPQTPDPAKPDAASPPCPKEMDAIPVSIKAPKAPTAPVPTDKAALAAALAPEPKEMDVIQVSTTRPNAIPVSAGPNITALAASVPATPPEMSAIPISSAASQTTPVLSAPVGVALIGIDDFFKVKLVTGEVVSAVPHPKADRLLILQVKVGAENKQIVSGIRQFYTPEQMVGKTIIVVNNLQPSKLRGEMSYGMLLAVRLPEGGLRLVTTDGPASAGLEVS